MNKFLRKQAAAGATTAAASALSVLADTVKSGLKTGTDITKDLAKDIALPAFLVAVPALGLGLSYLLSKSTSPYAIAENAEELAINANERESLATSIHDLLEIKRRKALKGGPRVHDKYI